MIMDIIIMMLAFLGVAVGVFIGRHTYEELKKGERYFILFKNFILVIIAVIFLLGIKQFSLALLMLFLIGFLIAHFLRLNYLFLGFGAVASIAIGNSMTILPLVYLYGLPFGTIRYYHIKNHVKLLRALLVNFILFMLPIALLFFDFDSYALVAFAAGALVANVR